MQSMEVVIRNNQIISFDKNDLCLCYIKLFGILLFRTNVLALKPFSGPACCQIALLKRDFVIICQ